MNFEDIPPLLREGKTFTRLEWDDKHQRVTLVDNGCYTKFYKVVPCEVAHYKHAKLGYNPTPTDILANDWTELK